MSTPEQPEPTQDEKEASQERREDEDAQRGPGHEDPERAREPEE
ncbi:MAG TPA: hypothetical protein VE644_12650 [Gaiellaceae bacterium]|nr:hypothetical protein [Gaiellaceae bacterium]